MKEYKILETEYGKLKYGIENDYVKIIEYSGKDLTVEIPEFLDGKRVTKICKKAFLSQKYIKTIILPDSIEYIEDYAFARCRKLESLILTYKKYKLGQDILKDSNSLNYITNLKDIDNSENDIAYLLAKTLNELNAFFLFDLENAGSDDWFKHLDSTINLRLDKDDMEDFSKMILCGEEEVVCGEDGTIEDSDPIHYKSNRVKEKIRIAFLRLLHDYKINKELKKRLINYLLDHIKGCETDETWQVVLNEHGDDKRYYDFLLEIGGINPNNFDDIMLDMGNRYTEIKSYLLKINDENKSKSELFSDFEL